MADGGNVELVEIDGLVVKLKLNGACGSCPSSTMTLKMGIQRRLMERIPEIMDVEQVMDTETGLALTDENVEKVLDEIRPYLTGAPLPAAAGAPRAHAACLTHACVPAGTGGGTLALDKIDGVVCKVKLSGPAAAVMTVRVAVTQKLREKIPSIAAVQLV
jgi:Fe-S cluster biogenesis protein NfuA